MTRTKEQPPNVEEKADHASQQETMRTRVAKDPLAELQRQEESRDAQEKSRADTAAGVARAEANVRMLQAKHAFVDKAGKGDRAHGFEVLGAIARKALGTAGMVAAITAGFEFSKITSQSAAAATLEKSTATSEMVDMQKGSGIGECRRLLQEAGGPDAERGSDALKKLIEIARAKPDVFTQFLEQTYTPAEEGSGRTLYTDWGISKADIQTALTDPNQKFSMRNSLHLMGTLLNKDRDLLLTHSSPDQIVVKEYQSQAYSDNPHPENGHVVRRDVLFHTAMSGKEYTLRGAVRYDDRGAIVDIAMESHQKNAHPFEPDMINNESDERIGFLSGEFQQEFVRYQHGELGTRTFSEYAGPGRELMGQIRLMSELERRGFSDEAQAEARKAAQTIRRIESGGFLAKGEGQGRGFFDYSKFPGRVQEELAKEAASVDQLGEVIQTRGGMAFRQLERDINTETQKMFSREEK